jgi:Rho-binding antiterminator
MSDYRPIDCGIYSRYEVAILHQERLRLRWVDDAGTAHLATLHPEDLQTLHGEEFLVATALDGTPLRVRLDRIHGYENLDDSGTSGN